MHINRWKMTVAGLVLSTSLVSTAVAQEPDPAELAGLGVAMAELAGLSERLSGLSALQGMTALESLAPLQGLQGLAGLQGLQGLAGLQGLSAGMAKLSMSLSGWSRGPSRRVALGGYGFDESVRPPAPWIQGDPADSLYRLARRELNRRNWERAAGVFRQIRTRYGKSEYAPDAYYWEAFARYRLDDIDQLETALDLLKTQGENHPDASTHEDARSLAVQVRGRLAQRGNANAAQDIARQAEGQGQGCPEEEDDVRLMALNALLNMDSDRAVPILRRVLERRDGCSVQLRRKAVWLISQKRSPETTATLLSVVRSDPDQEVREQAVFWLSQVRSEEAVTALDSILIGSDDQRIQEKAIFALSQHRSERATQALRRYAQRTDVPDKLRENTIFWLGQSRGDNDQFLRDLYGTVESNKLKEKIIFALSQQRGEEAGKWLLDIALNKNEPIKLRKSALFWAGQKRKIPIDGLNELYSTMDDREMREQVIFVLSQRKETAAVDALMNIVKEETDRELQKKAIFWLGQSKDPRIPEFLLEIINRDLR